jgi:hypothetical protein
MTLSDYKLLKMSWIYDVIFFKFFEIIRKRKHLEKAYKDLPEADNVSAAYLQVKFYSKRECRLCQIL